MSEDRFGCDRCWPASSDAAWEAIRALAGGVALINESHYHVTIRRCGLCGQRLLSVFTETIDWIDGEDPQYWTVIPITGGEAARLIERGDSLSEPDLESLPEDRRSLHRDFPKGASVPRTSWSAGLMVGPHD